MKNSGQKVKLTALKGGVLPNGSASQPGKDFFSILYSSPRPRLKRRGRGEQNGQLKIVPKGKSYPRRKSLVKRRLPDAP